MIDSDVFKNIIQLAKQQGIEERRDNMFGGSKINWSEDRAVLHTALRNLSNEPVLVDGKNIMPEIQQTKNKVKAFVESVHEGEYKGYYKRTITDIVSIGIGGSFLGPKIMSEALKAYKNNRVRVHFVANVDDEHILEVLEKIDHRQTLIITSSKSFTTQETLQHTITAKNWFLKCGGNKIGISTHFIAISSNVLSVQEFGKDKDNIFPMWDWVGGRYSLWSAIGLPLALSIGYDNFHLMLEGAYEMDKHFVLSPLEQNLPVILALIGIWNINFLSAENHVVLPYCHSLRGLPAYLQQLEMESNGKRITKSMEHVDYSTGPIIWNSEGTNGQHSFHQLLHQGTRIIPADFILPLKPSHESKAQSSNA